MFFFLYFIGMGSDVRLGILRDVGGVKGGLSHPKIVRAVLEIITGVVCFEWSAWSTVSDISSSSSIRAQLGMQTEAVDVEGISCPTGDVASSAACDSYGTINIKD